ncbi:hypothetical protein AGMMS49592_5580 [Endomicrobiia bacterium]|nr:hypothetical protein AGMMS49592_5580 [Endomicrobiia bacterium]
MPGHFWYKSPRDSYVSGDCALYAAVRFLRHAGQLGIVDEDLWTISNQELRNILADELISDNPPSPGKEQIEDCRKQGKWLTNLDIYKLLYVLDVPERLIYYVVPLN